MKVDNHRHFLLPFFFLSLYPPSISIAKILPTLNIKDFAQQRAIAPWRALLKQTKKRNGRKIKYEIIYRWWAFYFRDRDPGSNTFSLLLLLWSTSWFSLCVCVCVCVSYDPFKRVVRFFFSLLISFPTARLLGTMSKNMLLLLSDLLCMFFSTSLFFLWETKRNNGVIASACAERKGTWQSVH